VKRVFGVFTIILLAAGIGGAALDPAVAGKVVVSKAVRKTDVNLAECLRVASGGIAASKESCPGFIREGLPGLIDLCSGARSELKPADVPVLWSLDVDADGRPEYLIDLTENYRCNGAPSALSCGSLGCPSLLYAKQDGGWKALANVSAEDVPGIEVLAAPAGEREGTLRGGCVGARPCDELTLYSWQGAGYEPSAIEARGHFVDLVPGELWNLVEDTPVLASPAAGSKALGRYTAGTEVVLRGAARDAPAYRYISPCNSCESGFVPAGALRKEEAR
jgi:hypothetical protein